MQHPDEGMIHTWLDGELPAEEAAALEAHAAACEQCRAAIADARGLIAASSRIVSSLDAVPAGVIPIAKKPAKRMWYSSAQFRAAAAVLVVAGASLLVMRSGIQKPTLADSRQATSEAAPVMSAGGRQSSASSPKPVQPPVVADQAARKVEAARPALPQAARDMATLRAPATAGTFTQKVVTHEDDFSGKGVKGGSANGVAGGRVGDSVAVVSEPAMKAVAESGPRSAFTSTQPDLKILRVDSSILTRKTTYRSLSGSEVVLTEQGPEAMLSEVMVTGSSTESRDSKSRRAAASANSAAASAPASPAPAPSAPPLAAQAAIAVHTITWTDSSTRRRYSLSGPVSVEELEVIKARILQTKH